MKFKILDIKGAEQLQKKLNRLANPAAKRALRKAIRAGLAPIRAAIKRNAPKDEGDLRRSASSKVYGKGYAMGGVAGSTLDYVRQDGEEKKVPANYDHLVEFGHVNQDGSFTPPHPFMRPAAAQSKAASEAAFVAKLRESIEAEASK